MGCLTIIVVVRGSDGKEEEINCRSRIRREEKNEEKGKKNEENGKKNRTSNRTKVRKSIMTTLMWGGDRGQWVLSNQ